MNTENTGRANTSCKLLPTQSCQADTYTHIQTHTLESRAEACTAESMCTRITQDQLRDIFRTPSTVVSSIPLQKSQTQVTEKQQQACCTLSIVSRTYHTPHASKTMMRIPRCKESHMHVSPAKPCQGLITCSCRAKYNMQFHKGAICPHAGVCVQVKNP